MDFWKSGIVRWAVGGIAGMLVSVAARYGLDLGVNQEQIVDAIITVGGIVTFGVILLKRTKGNPPAINRETVPTPVAKMAKLTSTKNRGSNA